MLMTFDKKVSIADQLLRSSGRKKVGRKHEHNWSSKKVEKERAKQKKRVKYEAAKRKKYSVKVSAYWRGELDNYP